jgi:hypothetical protein
MTFTLPRDTMLVSVINTMYAMFHLIDHMARRQLALRRIELAFGLDHWEPQL